MPANRPASDDELSVENLKKDRLAVTKGVAPDWVRFITTTIDVQSTYFPVQVTGWDMEGRRTVIDRFDLFQPPAGDNGVVPDRKLSPAKFPGDWDVLAKLEDRLYAVEGTDYALKPCALVVDFQGEAGVSDNAEEFWWGRKKAGSGARWFLSRGQGGFQSKPPCLVRSA